MTNEQMIAALAALHGADLMTETKITDPLGAGLYYRADTVVRLIQQEREACAKVCDDVAEHYGQYGGDIADHCGSAIRKRSA